MEQKYRPKDTVTASLVLGQRIGRLLLPLLGAAAITAGGLLVFFWVATALLGAL